ncbi:hypothetical protein O6H91_01G174800 [Diphasiastrum complanatum]|uniref:Uncharacterized protein n=1 Tax=Diphasiastrum complanatum TaxID=34168 RepID=A0ACC2EZ83_DIPCM|nr:hypothetical protein O6H91_Y300600 [Diphasiastrum complanatum]KAJ7571720.1 hypothetical protein O6H91_01G174800 [Diphasiastrum complanatum]
MILLKNNVLGSTMSQNVRGNARSEEFNFPMQGFAGKYDDLNRKSIKILGLVGPTTQDRKRATGVNSVHFLIVISTVLLRKCSEVIIPKAHQSSIVKMIYMYHRLIGTMASVKTLVLNWNTFHDNTLDI